MVQNRRAFNQYPEYLRTDQNNRETYVTDDVMFEPERADFLIGYIGDVSSLTDTDLERTPRIVEDNSTRQKYQLTIGSSYIDPDNGEYLSGAFYQDLLRHLGANGAILTDPNRLFETPFYAWSPPIDYDKHTNFSRYFWVGEGAANVNGEYVTKEQSGTQIVLYRIVSGGLERIDVTPVDGLPPSGTIGEIVEDASTPNRLFFRWNGSVWNNIDVKVVPDDPDPNDFPEGVYFYITRVGPSYQGPTVWEYVGQAGRWISRPVVVSLSEPDTPREGMIWEDARISPNRVFCRFSSGIWVPISASPSVDLSVEPQIDNTYRYDIGERGRGDDWSVDNWWRHHEDLSPADRESLGSFDQAIRPIVEFWSGIEGIPNDEKTFRNQAPRFNLYQYDTGTGSINLVENTDTTIYQYRIGTGSDDVVLGFPLSFNPTGEFQFELTLESQFVPNVFGYRYFRDSNTGLIHSVWAKAETLTSQPMDQNDLYEVPTSITSNPNHEILTIASRSRFLNHFSSIIRSQDDFEGTEFGLNNYRWTKKNPTIGATIVDNENTLLRALGTLQSNITEIPDAIRSASRDYNRVLFKFTNIMNQMFDDLSIADPSGSLIITPSEAVDIVLTRIFVGRNESFPYFYSDMGEFVETEMSAGIAVVIDGNPKPIFVPPSPARIGTSSSFKPESFSHLGKTLLRGHEGVIVESFGDDRDLVWLELQNRFFQRVPDFFKTETNTFSSRFNTSNFHVENHYGNSRPTTFIEPVNQVVDDHEAIVSPSPGLRVLSRSVASIATFNGSSWTLQNLRTDDVIESLLDQEYHIYNGQSIVEIRRFDRDVDFDYTTEEFRSVIRREFERWVTLRDDNFTDNTGFDPIDPFTWNYRSAGLEGNYRGIYRRVYNTVRPHSKPWEILGYSIKPEWWDGQYPTGISGPDGTPRWADTDSMWSDIQGGVLNPITGKQDDAYKMVAPIPVNQTGELIDPIESGLVKPDSLVQERRDDSWLFGDGSPIEEEFYNSPYWGFTKSLAGFLMKPGIWVDPNWSLLLIDIGEGQLWRGPHIVHNDTLTRPKVEDLPIHLTEDEDGSTLVRLGVQAWISERIRIRGNDPDRDFARIIQNTTPTLGWRTSGFINPNRTVVQSLGGTRIPFEDIHTILHRSAPIGTQFSSGMFVQREGTGYTVFGFDMFDPKFRVELPAVSSVGGQVELRQEFISEDNQHIFEVTEFSLPRTIRQSDTAKVSVIINGLKIRDQFVHLVDNRTVQIDNSVEILNGSDVVISTITASSNSATRVKRFTVRGTSFEYFSSGSGQIVDIPYGRFFQSSTDVINFMIAYGRAQESEGWIFDSTDESTGTVQDWMTGAKLFADWAIRTSDGIRNKTIDDYLDQQDGFIYSPIARQVKFKSEFGQILNAESLQNGIYGVIDDTALPIDPEEIFTSRIGPEITLTAVGESDMFGVRLNQVEFQHVVFFSNTTRFNDTIYDPITGEWLRTLRVDTYRSENWNGRLEADGSVIQGGALLPNFEKQAFDITRFYDRINTVDDPSLRDQGRNLYGWSPNDSYMDAIGADDRSRFDYYRGMIKAKGTIRANIAFNRGTRLGSDQVVVTEDWAWKFSSFGDMRKQLVQFSVNRLDFEDQNQIFQFGGIDDPADNIVVIPGYDRTNPDPTSRWILPPVLGDGSVCDFSFPVGVSGVPRNDIVYRGVLSDSNSGNTVLGFFHYDPDLDRYEPESFCQIDYRSSLDPARYTNGPGADYSSQLSWGRDQVGHYWWNTDRLEYTGYRTLIPDYPSVGSEWGRLKYYRANVVRTGQTVRVETLDPYSGEIIEHGLETGDTVEITGSQQSDYNGEIEITVVSPSGFEYEINGTPISPATGDILVRVGFIDIMEWVESPVPPTGWEDYSNSLTQTGAPNGIVDDPENASYVEETRYINGIPETVYYFWIRDNSGDNPLREKEYSARQTRRRLETPTGVGIAWFAPVDSTHMIMNTNGVVVEDSYCVQLIVDQRDMESHSEWTLISEGDRFREVPDIIRQKIFDSMVQQDVQGNPVPSPLLAPDEQYGSDFFPPQSVFRNPSLAIEVFVKSVNFILSGKNITSIPNITGIFPILDEGIYWNRTEYRDLEYVNIPVFDTVPDQNRRDQKQSMGSYAEGDLVTVINTGIVDPWLGEPISITYVLENDIWLEVGRSNSSVELKTELLDNLDDFRRIYQELPDILDRGETNSYTFSLLYEMMRQNPNCDWFIKTSYLSVQIFDQIGKSPFVRASEPDAIIENLLDTKAYRSKLRSETSTLNVEEVEDMSVNIREFLNQKYTLLFDRLACDLSEDGGWDSYPWDVELLGWDKPFWDFEDLGRGETYSLGEQFGNDIMDEFVFEPRYDPTLYENTVILRFEGNEIDPEQQGIIVGYSETPTRITVRTNFPLTENHSVEVRQSIGFYEGNEPDLGMDQDSDFRATPESYEHHVARTIVPGGYNPADDMDGCPDGNPEERISMGMEPGMVMCVKTDHTSAYAGWDATPWDSAPWDQSPQNVGRRVFFISATDQTQIPPGLMFFPTSEDKQVDADPVFVPFIIAENVDYDIVEVRHNGDILQEGVNYRFVEPFTNIIELLGISDLEFIADGATTGFDVSSATSGVDEVFLNGIKQVDGINYNIVGNNVEFVQPPITTESIIEFPRSSSHIGDGVNSEFPTGHDKSSLHPNNIFVFRNGNLLSTSEYTAGGDSQLVINSVPPTDDSILVLAQGNLVADSNPIFQIIQNTGDGIETEFTVGFNARKETSFVFIDNRYQIFGTDYNITTNGIISFVLAPPTGAQIETRVLDPSSYLSFDYSHVVITASGGTNDPVPGLFNLDPRGLMVFVGDELQNGYTTNVTPDYVISDGSPDEIVWTGTPPAPGSTISVRFLRQSVISETNIVNVLPNPGDQIRVVPNNPYLDGDTIRFIFNGWPIGPLGTYRITDIPGDYDITNGKLVLSQNVPDPDQLITVNYTRSRRGELNRSSLVRMELVVDDLLDDHLVYDNNGFESNRLVGTTVINRTSNEIFRWDGDAWVNSGTISPGNQIFVRRKAQIVEYNGVSYNVIFEVGDNFTSPPILEFPMFGTGFTYATYALGQLPDAATDFPAAYQIIQHDGDC